MKNQNPHMLFTRLARQVTATAGTIVRSVGKLFAILMLPGIPDRPFAVASGTSANNLACGNWTKNLQLGLYLMLLATLLPHLASANLVGPYPLDTNTLILLHFDETSGTTTVTNPGTFGHNFISTTITNRANPAVNLLGATGYSTNSPTAISFGGCLTNSGGNSHGFGCDYNNDGIFDNTTNYTDYVPLSSLNMGNGTNTPWTVEMLVQPNQSPLPNTTYYFATAESTGSGTRRGFQFRITTTGGQSVINFIAVDVSGSTSDTTAGTIPLTGPDAIVSNAWYHVAASYDGTNVYLYWTRLDPSNGSAHLLNSTAWALGSTWGGDSSTLIIGNYGRGGGASFPGGIDEVRFSNVCRAANQMQFFSPAVTITAQPSSQNVDYNGTAVFNVGAATTGSTLGYQWRFNSNNIPGATGTTYTIPNVAAYNAGYYDCVVTNTLGYTNVTGEAKLVVGAANFLSHRYSFTADDTDSIGGANGTNFGNAYISGGQLVLDGSTGTYMQLPASLYTSSSATALTVEFWATFGPSVANQWVFIFNGSYNSGTAPVDFFGLRLDGSGAPEIEAGRSLQVDETLDDGTSLDGVPVHLAYTWDPLNKTIAIYTNGVLAAINNTNATVALADVNDGLSFLGYLGISSGYLNANFDELRIYNGALNALSLQQSDNLGPNQVLADGPVTFSTQPASSDVAIGNTATFTATAVGYLPISYQWFTNGVPVPGATNSSFAFVPALGDNNDQVVCYATNTIGATTYSTNSVTATLLVVNPSTVTWTANSSDVWDTSTANWSPGGPGSGFVTYGPLDSVIFDDEFNAAGTVNVVQAVNPQSITLNSAGTYDFSSANGQGSLTGPGTLALNNTGTLIVDLTNNLTGAVTISSGTLQLGNGDTLGSLGNNLPVADNGTLAFDRTDAISVGNLITGSGGVNYLGAGTVTLTTQNTYSGPTLISNGIVHLGAPENAGTSGPLGNGGAIAFNGGWLQYSSVNRFDYSGRFTSADGQAYNVDTAGQNVTWANSFGGTGSTLTKVGLGTLTLSGGTSYTGNTTISNGTVQAVSLGNGNVSVGSGATLVAGASNVVATLALGGNLALNSSILVFDITNPANASTITVAGNVAVSGVTTIFLSNTNPVPNGIYPLLSASGTLGGSVANFTLASGSVPPKTYALAYAGNQLVLQVSGPVLSYTWIGNGSYPANGGAGYWDINLSTNWGETGAAAAPIYVFNNGDVVVFDDTASVYSVYLPGTVVPASMTINSANGYQFSGPGGIGGTNGLKLTGSGTVTMALNNSYTGPTVIQAGTLAVSADQNLGADPVQAAAGNVVIGTNGTLAVTSGFTLNAKRGLAVGPAAGSGQGTIDVPAGQTLAYAGAVANNGGGTGGLILTDAGKLVLSGTNTYTGATTINGGELDISNWGANGMGNLSVGNASGSTGTLGISGGILALGNSAFYVGLNGGVGIVNQSGGTVAFTGNDDLLLGNESSSTATYNLSGGTIYSTNSSPTRGVMIGVNPDNTTMTFNLSGTGNIYLPAAELAVGRADDPESGNTVAFNQTGGTATFGYLCIGGQSGSQNTIASVSITGGTFLATNFQYLVAAANSTATITLGGSAQVTLPAFPTPAGTANLTLDFANGYLAPSAASTNYMSGLNLAGLTRNGVNFNVAAGNNITVPQVFQDAPAQTGGTLTKSGAGVLTLSGASTYTGATTLSNGVVNVGGVESPGVSGPLGTQAANAAGTIRFAGGTLQFSAANQNDYSGRFSAAGQQAFNLDVNGQTVTLATPLTSAGGSLTLSDSTGGGILTLSAASAYSGNTTVSGGNLVLNYATLATNSTVTVSNGLLTLNFGVTNLVASLVLNGVAQPGGVYNQTTSPGSLAGTGSLMVPSTGPGTFTSHPGITGFALNGANVVITGTNGQAGDAYYLLGSTNLTLPVSRWTPLATNVLSGSGNFTFTGTNVVIPGAWQQFYLLSNTNN